MGCAITKDDSKSNKFIIKDWDQKRSPHVERCSSNLLEFEKLKTIGMGRFSHVKLVRRNGELFAVKIYSKHKISVKNVYAHQVLNESHIHNKLDNTFVIQFHSYLEDSHHLLQGLHI